MSDRYRVQMAFNVGDTTLKRGTIIDGKTAESYENYRVLLDCHYITPVEEKEVTPVVINTKPETKKKSKNLDKNLDE